MAWPYAALVWDVVLPLPDPRRGRALRLLRPAAPSATTPRTQCADPTPTPGPPTPTPAATPAPSGASPAPSGDVARRLAGGIAGRVAGRQPGARVELSAAERHRAPDARPRQGRRGPRAAAPGGAAPEIGINDVLIRVHKTGICGTDLHIDVVGQLGGEDDRAAARRRARVRRRDRRGRLERQRLPPRRPRQRRGPRDLRPLPALHGRPAPPVREHGRPGRRARRLLRRVRRPADDEHLAPLGRDRRGGRGDLRPVRQRGPHGAGVRGPRRGRAHLRRRPDRAHGDRRRPARRRAPRRRLRADRRSGAALAEQMGATIAVDPTQRDLKDVQRELGMVEGFDVALEMSGNARALRSAIENMAHGGRIAQLGIPTGEITLDVNAIVFNQLTLRGIYGREMYETLVPVGGPGERRPRHQARDHPPLRVPRVRGGVRRCTVRRLREGHHGLAAMSDHRPVATRSPSSRPRSTTSRRSTSTGRCGS